MSELLVEEARRAADRAVYYGVHPVTEVHPGLLTRLADRVEADRIKIAALSARVCDLCDDGEPVDEDGYHPGGAVFVRQRCSAEAVTRPALRQALSPPMDE